jgi:cell wall-associated NlpC family hydrolase
MKSALFRSALFCLLLFAGCSSPHSVSGSVAVPAPTPGERAVAAAEQMVGRPYKLSGETPEGFDCSGLVRYSYLAAGIDLPHHTLDLMQRARIVHGSDLQKGDLVFFDENGRKYSHVGIYAGENLFIHAASTGKVVRIDSLADTYWREHFLDGRRL